MDCVKDLSVNHLDMKHQYAHYSNHYQQFLQQPIPLTTSSPSVGTASSRTNRSSTSHSKRLTSRSLPHKYRSRASHSLRGTAASSTTSSINGIGNTLPNRGSSALSTISAAPSVSYSTPRSVNADDMNLQMPPMSSPKLDAIPIPSSQIQCSTAPIAEVNGVTNKRSLPLLPTPFLLNQNSSSNITTSLPLPLPFSVNGYAGRSTQPTIGGVPVSALPPIRPLLVQEPSSLPPPRPSPRSIPPTIPPTPTPIPQVHIHPPPYLGNFNGRLPTPQGCLPLPTNFNIMNTLIGHPPPVTVMVPYPVLIPIPLPIPVPLPIVDFYKAYLTPEERQEFERNQKQSQRKPATSATTSFLSGQKPNNLKESETMANNQNNEAENEIFTDEPLDYTKVSNNLTKETTTREIGNDENNSDDFGEEDNDSLSSTISVGAIKTEEAKEIEDRSPNTFGSSFSSISSREREEIALALESLHSRDSDNWKETTAKDNCEGNEFEDIGDSEMIKNKKLTEMIGSEEAEKPSSSIKRNESKETKENHINNTKNAISKVEKITNFLLMNSQINHNNAIKRSIMPSTAISTSSSLTSSSSSSSSSSECSRPLRKRKRIIDCDFQKVILQQNSAIKSSEDQSTVKSAIDGTTVSVSPKKSASVFEFDSMEE